MIRKTIFGATAVAGAMLFAFPALAAKATPAAPAAKGCRDPHGKFMRCPASAPAKPPKCRSIKTGHYAKCGTPGTKPA